MKNNFTVKKFINWVILWLWPHRKTINTQANNDEFDFISCLDIFSLFFHYFLSTSSRIHVMMIKYIEMNPTKNKDGPSLCVFSSNICLTFFFIFIQSWNLTFHSIETLHFLFILSRLYCGFSLLNCDGCYKCQQQQQYNFMIIERVDWNYRITRFIYLYLLFWTT